MGKLERKGLHVATCNHKWARTGLFIGGILCAPCLRNGCEAEYQHDSGAIKPGGFPQTVDGIKLDITDDPVGGVAKIIMREIEGSYDFDSIPFFDGDVVIDVGAHVGVVSIYLAKRYPGITVYAIEPVEQNYGHLIRNIKANGVSNVVPIHCAVTSDGRQVEIKHSLNVNSGGGSVYAGGDDSALSESMTLRDIFIQFGIERCKLLKIDCEGCEYGILGSDGCLMNRIEYLRGEIHTNSAIECEGYSVQWLNEKLMSHFDLEKVKLSFLRI